MQIGEVALLQALQALQAMHSHGEVAPVQIGEVALLRALAMHIHGEVATVKIGTHTSEQGLGEETDNEHSEEPGPGGEKEGQEHCFGEDHEVAELEETKEKNLNEDGENQETNTDSEAVGGKEKAVVEDGAKTKKEAEVDPKHHDGNPTRKVQQRRESEKSSVGPGKRDVGYSQ